MWGEKHQRRRRFHVSACVRWQNSYGKSVPGITSTSAGPAVTVTICSSVNWWWDEVTMAPGRWEESRQMYLATREEESRKVWVCAQISSNSKAWLWIQGGKTPSSERNLKHFQYLKKKIKPQNTALGGTAVETFPNNPRKGGQGWTDCIHLQEEIMTLKLHQSQQA